MTISSKALGLSEISSMPVNERQASIDGLFQAALNPTKEQIEQQKEDLNVTIQIYESRFGITSNEMKASLSKGRISESAEICDWLMLLRIKDRFVDSSGSCC